MDLLQALRAATEDCHRRIERLPLSRAMIEGRVRRSVYLALLAELLAIHRVMEGGLSRSDSTPTVYRPVMARAALLVQDRAALGDPEPETSGTESHRIVEVLEERAQEGTFALTGALYILEGSRMGSLMLAKPLARGLGVPLVPGHGLDYHLDGLLQRPRAWQEFKAALQGLSLTPAEQREVVRGAADLMQGLHDLYESLSAEVGDEDAEVRADQRNRAGAHAQ